MDVDGKDQLLKHFSHEHSLNLVHLQQSSNHKNEDSDNEDENEEKDDFVEEVRHGGQCSMCKEQIWSFHQCYYYCKSCDYSLHKFCAELPKTQRNNPSHPGHNLKLFYCYGFQNIKCFVCNNIRNNIYVYYCVVCETSMDIICATMSKQKMNHHSHPHQLERIFMDIVSRCVACGNKHEGVFFQCTTCPMFRINLKCALMPAKLLIQISTNGTFTHSHPLTLAYSSPALELTAKFTPRCRACDNELYYHLWNYKCYKCLYYMHVDCATSQTEPFMSIFLPAGLGKTYKNYREDEHPNLLHCPFKDEGDNLLKHYMSNQKELIGIQYDGEMLNHSSHQHPLIIFNKQTSVDKALLPLHDPMKRVRLLCDACVKPIMTIPFYMCCKYVDEQCCFVLHEWCAKLPYQVPDYAGHPEHTLFLLPKIRSKFFGVFECEVCELPSNGFAYGCTTCGYYVDINCAFIPEKITHDAHPNHLLLKVKPSTLICCKACGYSTEKMWGFQCRSCGFYIHIKCALLLPRLIKHKCDRHPLSLRYEPAENHIGKYFCEICENEFNPWQWFYHCTICGQSMHRACAPRILQCEQVTHGYVYQGVYKFLNIKFGGTLEIKGHPHLLSFVEGLESVGNCIDCRKYPTFFKRLSKILWDYMIFKCKECEFALHYGCASSFAS